MSAIRSYLSPLVPVCRAIAPIAMDFGALLYFDRKGYTLPQHLFLGTACGVGTLGCLWWRRNISPLEKVATVVLFTAWKAIEAFLVLKNAARANQRISPTAKLQNNFIIPNGTIVNVEEIRQRWQDHEITLTVLSLFTLAAHDLDILFYQLVGETNSSGYGTPAQFTAMANLLQNNKEYRDRFVKPQAHPLEEPVQLLNFYRFVRGQGYSTTNDKGQPQYGFALDEQYAQLFHQQEGPQKFWRERYNTAIKQWAPVIKCLPADSPLRQWAVEDNTLMPVPDDSPTAIEFELRPTNAPLN